AALAERAGALEEAAGCLQRVLAADPCRRDLALALRRELDLAPDRETEAQYRAALEGRQRASRARSNLPPPSARFVGREAGLAGLEGLLGKAQEAEGAGEGPRLVTLLGPGGVGKSRLAVEVGRIMLPSYPDGVWLVELAGMPPSGEVDPQPV